MKRKIIYISSAILAAVLCLYFVLHIKSNVQATYTTSLITRGNINVVITSTGTLEATSTVDVGTQVTGKVSKLFVDFNSVVKQGQLLAIIDTVTLAAQVREANANLAKAKAEYNQKTSIHERNKKLYEKKYISDLEIIQSRTDVESTLAALQSAEVSLEKAKTNLSYAFIYAPISGRIINRSVEQGQTVAASLSAPTIFTIAQDLSSMRILANVDESDIGQIKEGQKVKFTVQTYTNKIFDGIVTQIRLKASTVSNVVNYTVVINAANDEQLLLPGMTATVDFYVDYREKVLLVPNAALRFEPSEALQAEIKKNMEDDFRSMPDSIKNRMRDMPRPDFNKSGMIQTQPKSNTTMSKIYFYDRNGKIKISPVEIGLTDGKNTEIIQGRELIEGTKIITGSEEAVSAPAKSANTLNGSQQNGPPPPMM